MRQHEQAMKRLRKMTVEHFLCESNHFASSLSKDCSEKLARGTFVECI